LSTAWIFPNSFFLFTPSNFLKTFFDHASPPDDSPQLTSPAPFLPPHFPLNITPVLVPVWRVIFCEFLTPFLLFLASRPFFRCLRRASTTRRKFPQVSISSRRFPIPFRPPPHFLSVVRETSPWEVSDRPVVPTRFGGCPTLRFSICLGLHLPPFHSPP